MRNCSPLASGTGRGRFAAHPLMQLKVDLDQWYYQAFSISPLDQDVCRQLSLLDRDGHLPNPWKCLPGVP